jgi:hypothetical protein
LKAKVDPNPSERLAFCWKSAKPHHPTKQPQVQNLEIKTKQNAENFAFRDAEFSREIESEAVNIIESDAKWVRSFEGYREPITHNIKF